MSQSPSSVRWHYDAMMHHLQHKRHIDDLGEGEGVDDFDRLSEAWNIPDATEMKRRLNVRKEILVETLQHRRIHRHGGIVCGRNIAHVLAHRETYGARALKHNRNYQLPLPKQAPDTQAAQERSAGTPGTPGALSAPRTPSISNSSPQASSSRPAPDVSGRTKSQRIPFAGSLSNEIRLFAEYCSVTRYHSAFFRHLGGDDELDQNGQRPSSSNSVSTISVAFSPDSLTMASTHGDHTVKITSSASGHLLQTLEGHPRTPWTVKYLPHDASIIASGCLGHQVRIWNWETAVCLHMIRLEFAIISLSFHPTGQVLAIANGTRLHFWALDEKLRLFKCKGSRDQDTDEDGPNSNNSNSNSNSTLESTPTATTATTDANQATGSVEAQTTEQQRQNQRRGLLTEVEQRHMLRCVHFAPQGNTVIVGGVNPTAETPRPRRGGISGGGMSFYLRLWDFDLEAALRPGETNMGIRRRAISNPRTFLPRALLYNDGGFDVSPDGKTLCACAEYWLPDGVENALDLHPQEDDDESDSEDVDPAQANTNTFSGRATNNRTDASEARKNPRPLDGEHTLDTRPGLSVSPPRLRQPTPMHSPALIVGRHNPLTPQTPPTSGIRPHFNLSPPSPPGRRFAGGLGRPPATSGDTRVPGTDSQSMRDGAGTGSSSSGIPPPPPPGINSRPPNPFAMPNREGGLPQHGRYVPHVVTISLDTSPVQNDLVPGRNPSGRIGIPSGFPNGMPRNARPRLGQLLEACPLYGTKASAVTCVKFSPSTNFCLIGYGVREPVVEHNGNQYHPVTALYRIRGGMTHVSTMLSGDDDVNISRFHPDPGYGFVYGTKQGRVRVLSPRPWNYYNC